MAGLIARSHTHISHTLHTRTHAHRTFVAAAGPGRVDPPLLQAGRQAQLALVVVGVAVAAAHQRERLARARLALALVEDAAGAPGADHAAAGFWWGGGTEEVRGDWRGKSISTKGLIRL